MGGGLREGGGGFDICGEPTSVSVVYGKVGWSVEGCRVLVGCSWERGEGDLVAGGHRCARWVEMGAHCQLDDLWLHHTMVALVSFL